MNKLFGISNCDTVRKAKKWLETNQIDFEYIDFRKDQFSKEDIEAWLKKISFEDIVNQRSQAWKALTEEQKHDLIENKQFALLLDTPTLIKRPVLQTPEAILFGFKEAQYQEQFA